jgi:hypothetical protein
MSIVNRPNLKPTRPKTLQPCNVCADTVTGVPHGYVRTIDFQSNSNKIDPVYNTTMDCPVCKGTKYVFR